MASDFITGDALASSIGLTEGTSQNSTAGWLKFSLDSKTLYVAKKPLRINISWNTLNSSGLITGTTTTVIGGKTYKVRLLKGRGDGLTTDIGSGYDLKATWNSEWNRTMYHVCSKVFSTPNSEGLLTGDWAQYSENALGIDAYYSWVQELSGTNGLCYGYYGVSYNFSQISSANNAAYTWRPCLELIG